MAETIKVILNDLNYIPDYQKYEKERQNNELERIANEKNRQEYYDLINKKVYNGEFKGEKGEQGETGNGIMSIDKVDTNGLVDTYAITYTDNTIKAFNVTNGEKYDDTEVKTSISNLQNEDIEIKSDLNNKVDKIEGKNLSQNDFTDNYKNKLDNLSNYDDTLLKTQINANTNNIEGLQESKVDKVQGKVLSTNDFTNVFKEKLEGLENYDDTNIKTRISALETDNTENQQKNLQQDANIETLEEENAELKAECERLREDIKYLPTIAGNGENVTLEDTAEARFKKFRIGGNTIQEGDSSIETPAEIKNVEGNANITVCNNNMFDNNRLAELFMFFEDCTVDENNVVTFTNNNEQNVERSIVGTFGQGYHKEIAKRFKKGHTYIFSAKTNGVFGTVSGTNTVEIMVVFRFTDSTNKAYNLNQNGFKRTYTIPTDKDLLSVSWRIDINSSGYTYKFWDFQMEEGEIATEYEEHQEQNFLFPLAEGQLLHKTDYLADDGTHHKRKTILVDGENYGASFVFPTGWFNLMDFTNGYNNRKLVEAGNPVKDWATNGEIYCNKLTIVSSADILQRGSEGIAISVEGNIEIKLDDSIEENKWTVDSVNNYLSENPITIEYMLPEEEIEPYTEEQIAVLNEIEKTAKSYQGTTHVYSTDEISPIFEVEARKDIQAENDKLQNQIDEIKELLSTTTTSAMLLDNMQTDLEKEVI